MGDILMFALELLAVLVLLLPYRASITSARAGWYKGGSVSGQTQDWWGKGKCKWDMGRLPNWALRPNP